MRFSYSRAIFVSINNYNSRYSGYLYKSINPLFNPAKSSGLSDALWQPFSQSNHIHSQGLRSLQACCRGAGNIAALWARGGSALARTLPTGHKKLPEAMQFHQACWEARCKNQSRDWLLAPKLTQSELVLCPALHISIFLSTFLALQ